MQNDAKPLTAKQWQRRALKAEAEAASLRKTIRVSSDFDLGTYRKMAAMTVALREIADAVQFGLHHDGD